jgi:cation diffusion facilitator CzcD-associated flavoprotein CzcO
MSNVQQPPAGAEQARGSYDAVVIGAGFAGLYMLHRLREIGLSARVYEAGGGVGGTWYWNRYPGARCDSHSIHYSYSFSPELEQEWEWSELFASQPEILSYLNYVADRFDLRRDIQFETRVTAAHYDEAAKRWTVETDRGERVAAQFLITGVGCLSTPNTPSVAGLERFAGAVYHTGQWPHEGVDFSGLRVGVIGTGSSGIQVIPQIAKQAAHLTVFQRTANYSLPARNVPLTPEELARVKATYREIREANLAHPGGLYYEVGWEPTSALAVSDEERARVFEETWQRGSYALTRSYTDLLTSLEANQYLSEFVRAKIAEIVRDPEVARKLTPLDHPIGSKRIPIDTEYYQTFNRDNVSLVDVRAAPIETITPRGIRTSEAEYELDAIVFATGFDAMTGALLRIDIRGRAGLTLREKWAYGPRTFLGLQVAGFPNMFMITGPGSPSVLTNMPLAIEQHVDWIAECVVALRERDATTIEATEAAEEEWIAEVNEAATHTLYPLANNWYLGSNIPGKPRIFMPYAGGLVEYRRRCDAVAANGYAGFVLTT